MTKNTLPVLLLAITVSLSLTACGESEHWAEKNAATDFALGYYDSGCAGLHWTRKSAYEESGWDGINKFNQKHPEWNLVCVPRGF